MHPPPGCDDEDIRRPAVPAPCSLPMSSRARLPSRGTSAKRFSASEVAFSSTFINRPLQENRASGYWITFEKYITIKPGIRGGKPSIKGTRITVTDVLEYLAGGMTEEQILADFPADLGGNFPSLGMSIR